MAASEAGKIASGAWLPALMLEMLLPDVPLINAVKGDALAKEAVYQGLGIAIEDLYGRHLLMMAEKLIHFELSREASNLARSLNAE